MGTKRFTVEGCTLHVAFRENDDEFDFIVSKDGREIFDMSRTEISWHDWGWPLFELTRLLNEAGFQKHKSRRAYKPWIPLPMKREYMERKEQKGAQRMKNNVIQEALGNDKQGEKS